MISQKSSTKPSNPSWPLVLRRIRGHSMMPVLPPETLVFAWAWFRRLRTGDVVIFRHNGKEKIKRISKIESRGLYLLGDHADASSDSRDFGWLQQDVVMAKVFWPRAPKHRAEGVEKE